jgi:predicted permease
MAIKFRILPEDFKDGIARLVFNITLPLLILTNLSELDLTPAILRNSGLVILFSYIGLFLMFSIGNLSSWIQGLDHETRTVHVLHSMFGNVVFLGYPLINTLFPGGEGLLYATLFHLSSSSLQWTLGVYLLVRKEKVNWSVHLKHLLNPNTIALVLGLIMMGFSLRFPAILLKPLGGLGNTTLYLSMMYIGAILAHTSLKGILRKAYVLVLSVNKLIITPFLLILILSGSEKLTGFSLDETVVSVVVLQVAMPCMAIIVVMARQFKADEKQATENVFLSTVLSLLTLPLVYFLLQKF